METRAARRFDETGTGVIGTSFGAVVFLAFLAVASHTLIGLYATSVVTAVAWDNAQLVATRTDDPFALELAKSNAERRLSNLRDVRVDITTTPDDVAVQITARRPSLLPAALAKPTHLDTIDRTVHVRPETLR